MNAFRHILQTVAFHSIFADFGRNFRDPLVDYSSCLPTPGYNNELYLAGTQKRGLYESLFYEGLKVPIWVAELTPIQVEAIQAREKRPAGFEYKYRVIRGHRRMRALMEIEKNHPGRIETVECDVYSGLSEAEEWELLTDHGDTEREEGLSELGEYRAVCNLFAAGFGQEKIANMFGQTRGFSQRRLWIHKMGTNTPIEEHYLKRLYGRKEDEGTFVTFPMSVVDKLGPAWTADGEAGLDPMHPDATFRKLWDKLAETGRTPKGEKSLTRKELDERSAFVQGRPALVELLNFAANKGGNVAEAARQYDVVAEKAARVDALSAELAATTESRDKWKLDAETLSVENDNLHGEVETLTTRLSEAETTIDALRHDLDVATQTVNGLRAGKPVKAKNGH